MQRITILFLEILLPLKALRCHSIERCEVFARFACSGFKMEDHAGKGGELSGATEAADSGWQMGEFVLNTDIVSR